MSSRVLHSAPRARMFSRSAMQPLQSEPEHRWTTERLKCSKVWPEPSVSVAALPPIHPAARNDHGSVRVRVPARRHNTHRDNLSTDPRHASAASSALQQLGGKHG